MKKLYFILTCSLVVFLASQNVEGQNNCPSFPKKSWVDTLGYIKTEIPTDPAKAKGIWLGQGTVNYTFYNGIASDKRPGFIPSNRPSWAIAIAHAWNYSRNLIHRVEYPKIGYWMGTMIEESELNAAHGLTWSAPAQVPNAYPANVTSYMANGGAYQIEGPGSAYSALQQAYPYGRFPNSIFTTIIQGEDNQEPSSLVKVYYDVYTSEIFNYNMGWNFYKNIDCKLQYDAYAYEKMSASAYNGGPNAFLNAKTILDNTGPGCWSGLPGTKPTYAMNIAGNVAVFENTPSYCGYPTGSTFAGYYNGNIAWTDVTHYLSVISILYPEINFATQVTPKVQAAFIAKAGSLAATIPFQQLGSVVDAIILALPLERPAPVEGTPIGINLSCSGSQLPYGHVEILDGSTTMCLGNSVTLNLEVDATGGATAPTFKWYKGPGTAANMIPANLIGTGQSITITPAATGLFIYSAQICNGSGCYTLYSNSANACMDSRDINGFKITVNNCSSCSFTASSTSVNTPCKGMDKGKINLTLTNAPANYKVTYTGNTPLGPVTGTFNSTGSTVAINNLRDGSYNIVLEDLSNPTCKAYTNVIVNYTTNINEYIDAVKSPQAANTCTANITATLKELPAPCNWKIRSYVDVFFQWENWVNFGIQTSTGISTLDKNNVNYPKALPPVGIDQWNIVPASEQIMSLNTGDKIDFFIALTTTPGATQQRAYTIQVLDENNNIVYTVVAPVGASNSGPYKAGPGYTVTCPTPAMPAYTFSWSPALTTMTNTATTSSGTVNINFATAKTYTITATHPTNPACILTDTVIVQPTCPGAMPVEIVYFDANLINKAVDLEWVTANEKNCREFVIERSGDGINFEALTSVNCTNATSLSKYQFTDLFPLSGTSYYRLAQYDVDGKLYYSAVREITFNEISANIYPNPSTSEFNVILNGSSENEMIVKVIDVEGKIQAERTVKGNAKFSLGAELSAGIYVIQVQDQSSVKTYKVVKE